MHIVQYSEFFDSVTNDLLGKVGHFSYCKLYRYLYGFIILFISRHQSNVNIVLYSEFFDSVTNDLLGKVG